MHGIDTGKGTEAGADLEPGPRVSEERPRRGPLILNPEDKKEVKALAGSDHRHHDIPCLDLQTDHHQSLYVRIELWPLGWHVLHRLHLQMMQIQ